MHRLVYSFRTPGKSVLYDFLGGVLRLWPALDEPEARIAVVGPGALIADQMIVTLQGALNLADKPFRTYPWRHMMQVDDGAQVTWFHACCQPPVGLHFSHAWIFEPEVCEAEFLRQLRQCLPSSIVSW